MDDSGPKDAGDEEPDGPGDGGGDEDAVAEAAAPRHPRAEPGLLHLNPARHVGDLLSGALAVTCCHLLSLHFFLKVGCYFGELRLMKSK